MFMSVIITHSITSPSARPWPLPHDPGHLGQDPGQSLEPEGNRYMAHDALALLLQ